MSERDDAIRTIREALKYLRNYIKGFDCDYVDECYPGDPDACHTCKAVYQAEIAIAALDKLAVEPSDDAREFACMLGSIFMENVVYMTIKKVEESTDSRIATALTVRDERIRAEALREAATKARNAILDFGKGNTVSSRYSPMIRKEMAAQLAERAILGGTKRE